MKSKVQRKKQVLGLFTLIVAGSTIYELPYLSYSYYDSLVSALNITNTQLGALMSVFGLVAMFGYFPGGWLADRFESRKLLTFSLITMFIAGLVLSTFPSYPILVVIYAWYGFCTAVIFWSAMLKATRQLGESDEQGRLFGILESGRGLLPFLYGMVILAVFNSIGANDAGIKTVIVCYSILALLGAILSWFSIKGNNSEEGEKVKITAKDVLRVIKMPTVWMIGLIIFSSYILYVGMSYLTPYLTEIYGASDSTAAFLNLIRNYGLAVCGGLISGFIADRVGSKSKVLLWISILPVVGMGALMFLPSS